MSAPIYTVGAFAREPFTGNQAVVCLLEGPADARWMQRVAAEMNLSETAFLYPENGGYRLRWFTPTVEVALCGHATLASAHVLWTERVTTEETLRFETQSGSLFARREGEKVVLDFPFDPPHSTEPPAGLERALGAAPEWVGRGHTDLFVVLETAHQVRGLAPDLARVAGFDCRGVIVTAPSDTPEYDFISRFFAPQSGIDEDPVTGSAHCTLAPYWGARTGKTEMVGYQASRRGGEVGVRVGGDRVELVGQAVTVVRGALAVRP